jgi:serine/threonine protein kinase, bacterial
VGTELGPYRLGPVLGKGGMGEVYRAWDTRRGRWVALKLLSPRYGADPAYRRRFRREAEAAADLREPHVVPVHDFGEIDGQLFLDMRLIDGTDLGTVLVEGPLAPPRAIDLITQVAAALDAAHAAGLVHRDVKPSNVLVGPGDFAHLADFGIARSTGSETAEGSVIGTMAYMAPERLRAEPADARSDVYSLACLLHECLTGSPPFVADDPSALVDAHLRLPPPALTDDTIPPALRRVIARGMAKEPGDRPAGAGVFAAEARAALHTRATARLTRLVPPDRLVRGWRRWSPPLPGRWARRVLGLALAVLLLVVGIAAVRRYVGDGISVGYSPVAVAFSADGGDAYIANAGDRFVGVFDTGRRVRVGEVLLDGETVGAVADPAGEQLFVTTSRSDRYALSVIDMRTSAVVAGVALPRPPVAVPVVNARRTTAFVPTPRGIDVVDLRGRGVVGTLNRTATGLAPSADGTRLLTVDDRRATAEVVDVASRSTVTSIPLEAPARSAVASPDGTTVYLGSADPQHALTVVDPAAGTVVDSVALPGPVSALTVSRDGRRAFLALATADRPVLAAVDTDDLRPEVGWFMEEFTGRVALAASPDRREVYIVNTDLGTLTIDDVTRRP